MEMYLVGGIVRDMLMGFKPHDHDFVVVLPESTWNPYSVMREDLLIRGVEIFVETPQFLTIRGRFSKDDPEYPGVAADFVLARKDSTKKYCSSCNGSGNLSTCQPCKGTGWVTASDGRRPDYVEPGTLLDDLSRRDFTVNAMAVDRIVRSNYGPEYLFNVIDPFDGQEDLKHKRLVFVGDPMTRIREDALRVMRGLRFCITKGFTFNSVSASAIMNPEVPELLVKISEDRRAKELSKMFRFDTEATLECMANLPKDLRAAIFAGRVRLDSTLKA